MTDKRLIKAVAKRTKHRQMDVIEIVKGTLELIMDTLSNGEAITIKGFGSFYRISHNERNFHNIATRSFEITPARNSIKFQASRAFKDRVNGIKSKADDYDVENEANEANEANEVDE